MTLPDRSHSLWLDGTASYSGSRDLPASVQKRGEFGVVVRARIVEK